MKKIKIDFGNLIEELKNNDCKLFTLIGRNNWYLEDKDKVTYQIELYYVGSYLDRFIMHGMKIEFHENQLNIEDQNKEYWNIERINNFIKNI